MADTVYLHINDLDESIDGLVSKCSDNTKNGGVAHSEESCQKILMI